MGGGPAGSYTAWQLAKKGRLVTVLEEHQKIGEPSHCAGHLSIKSLKNLGLYSLSSGIIENNFSTANFYSPNGTKFAVKLNEPVTCAINRTLFDEYLATQAKSFGAKYLLSTRAQGLLLDGKKIKGVTYRKNENVDLKAKMVIDAEGISSRFVKQAGLNPFGTRGLVYAAEAELENVEGLDEHAVDVYTGSLYAPGFYGWLIPRPKGKAKLGLAIKRGNPEKFLNHLIKKHPVASKELQNAKLTRITYHTITLGGLIDKLQTDNFLVVGDAASQVKPTTGGGVIFSLICGGIAANVANQAIDKGDFSSEYLSYYQKRVQDRLGFDIKVMLKIRNFLNSLSDQKIDDAFRFANRVGLLESLRDVDEIDFQGRTILNLLKKPSVYAIIPYLFVLYFSANFKM